VELDDDVVRPTEAPVAAQISTAAITHRALPLVRNRRVLGQWVCPLIAVGFDVLGGDCDGAGDVEPVGRSFMMTPLYW
jgi:hypothetical protein